VSDPINFEIEHLVTRYELHPERQDVFVEGEQDLGLVRTFLEKHGRKNISVFSISVVNISDDLVLGRSLAHPSRRSETVTLAMELESKGVSSIQAACIADADLEYVLPQNLVGSLLLLTDYTSMELYAFSAEAVHDLLSVVSPKTTANGSSLLSDLTPALQFLFAVRATNFDLQFGLVWIESLERFFSVQKNTIQFDEAEFRKRFLEVRLPVEKLTQFETRLTEIRSKACSDVRRAIRGHDFVHLFGWFLRKNEKCHHLNDHSVRQMLYLRVRPEDLAKEPMFSSLLSRFEV
jgi:hypothetical protein